MRTTEKPSLLSLILTIILKEVKAALLSDKVTKDYKSLLQLGP